MSNLFCWASIGENGKALGGKKGDQTGKEVKVGSYYLFGQDKCIRIRNNLKKKKLAKIAKYLANSNVVGYNQSERSSLFNACARFNWDWDFIKKAIEKGEFPKSNTDCSAFYVVCVNLTYGHVKLSPALTTSTLVDECVKKNKLNFKLTNNFPPKKWKKGDAPIKEGKHIIINV